MALVVVAMTRLFFKTIQNQNYAITAGQIISHIKIDNKTNYHVTSKRITKHSHVEMDALQFNPSKRSLEIVRKAIPECIEDDKVLIKVCFAGICGTDLHIIDGEFPAKDSPLILGHEFCGVVEKLGKNVRHLRVGDRVVTDPNRGCMACDTCRSGNVHFCKNGGLNTTLGIYIDGGWGQFCLAPDVQVYRIPDSLTMEQAALTEPMSCIAHTWDLLSPVPIGKKILVLGSGIIGNLFASLLHVQGHRKVTISEPSDERKKIAQGLDTGYEIINPDVLSCRKNADQSYGFNLIIDCSGNAKAVERAFDLLDFGGTLCIFGVAKPDAQISIKPFDMFKKELKIMGGVINPFTFGRALSILEAMGSRYIDYEKLGIQVFALQDYKNAINCLRHGSIAKAIFKM